MSAVEQRRLLAFFLVAAVVLGAGLGLREPWPPDEPRFALIAKDMVESGNWLIPRVAGILYPDKPPLFFWLVGAFYWLTGSIAVAVLLPSFLAGLGVLFLVYDLARRLWDPEIALWSGAALLAILQFPLQMKSGQIDGLLCLWTTLGLYGLSRHLLLGPNWRWLTLGAVACGLGVITKGVGFLPFMILVPWLWARWRGWPLPVIGWSRGRWLLAVAAFILVIGLWLVPMWLATTNSGDVQLVHYRNDILLKQTVTRYADAWGHIKPAWYLLTNAVPWLWLPLSLLLPWLLPAWLRDLKGRKVPTLLFGGWVLLILLFFSLSEGKRSLYIFPAAPAFALLAGPHLPRLAARAGVRRLLFALALLLPTLLAVSGVYGLSEPSVLADRLVQPESVRSLAWGSLGIGLVAATTALAFRLRNAAAGYAGTMFVLWVGVSLSIYPRLDATRSGEGIIDAAARSLTPGQPLAFAGWKEQFLLQWNQPAVHFGYRRNDDEGESRDAAAWLADHPEYRLLLPQRMLKPCFDVSRLSRLGRAHRQQWFLANEGSVRSHCRIGAEAAAANVVRYRLEAPDDAEGGDDRKPCSVVGCQ